MVGLLVLPALPFLAAHPSVAAPRAAPGAPAPMAAAVARPTPPAASAVGTTASLLSVPEILPGLGPSAGSRPIGLTPAQLPSRASQISERTVLPKAPTTAGTSLRPVAPGSPPTNINLSGNSTLTIGSNTTVGSIALHNNAILYVHGGSVRVTLTVLGDIRLYDHSLLFVNASNLAIGETYDVEWQIQAMGASEFVLAYSNLTTNGYQWGAAYENDANVTIFASLVGYPSGWLDSSLLEAARLTVLDSWYSSDVILFDSVLAASTANFTAGDSAGFNVWLNFKAGTSANISLPGLEGWRNWTFPGTSHVSNVNYSVLIAYSFVQVFAIMLWQGANLTLVNSPDVAVSLNILSGIVNVTGFEQMDYARFAFDSGQFALTLWNTTIFTWNIYTFSGEARIANSEIGEIQVFGSTWTTVHNSTLTADGGYYGDQSTANLSIFDSKIAGQVVAYSGVTLLENCTVNTTYANRLLATGSGRLDVQDTWVAPVDTYQAIASGVVNVSGTVHANVSLAGAPVAGAQVTLAWASNSTAAGNGTTNSSGGWSGLALRETLNATATRLESYNGTAADGLAGAAWAIPDSAASLWFNVALAPLVIGSLPTNGSTGVPENGTAIVVQFADPMVPAPTQALVHVSPTVSVADSWDVTDRTLTLTPDVSLAFATVYTVEVDAGALTVTGVRMAGAYVVTFTTAPAPLVIPSVVAMHPANGSVNVSVSTNISVTFSIAMDATLVADALSVTTSPGGAVAGSTSVHGTLVVFVPLAALQFNSTYEVAIAATAASAAGALIGKWTEFSFHTVANTSSGPGPTTHPGGPSGSGSSTSGSGWIAGALVGILLAVIAAAIAVVVLRRRGKAPPVVNSAPVATASPPVPPPAWAEDESTVDGRTP
jgi:hypothetical protein